MSRSFLLKCFFQAGVLLVVGVARAAMARESFIDPVAGDDRASGLAQEVTGKGGLVRAMSFIWQGPSIASRSYCTTRSANRDARSSWAGTA